MYSLLSYVFSFILNVYKYYIWKLKKQYFIARKFNAFHLTDRRCDHRSFVYTYIQQQQKREKKKDMRKNVLFINERTEHCSSGFEEA